MAEGQRSQRLKLVEMMALSSVPPCDGCRSAAAALADRPSRNGVLGSGAWITVPITPGALHLGESHLLARVIALLRCGRTACSTPAVVAATPLYWHKCSQPLESMAFRACSEPHGHDVIELWIPGQHPDSHHQRTCEPGNRFRSGWAAMLKTEKRFTRDACSGRKVCLGETSSEPAANQAGQRMRPLLAR
jgi:hypothetical protein